MYNVTDLRFDDIVYRGHESTNNFLFALRATYTVFSLIVLAAISLFFLFIVFLLHLFFSHGFCRQLVLFDLWMFRVIYSVVAQKSFDKSSFCLNACIFIVSVGASVRVCVCLPFSCAHSHILCRSRRIRIHHHRWHDQPASNSKRQLQWMKTFSFCVNKHKHHTLR